MISVIVPGLDEAESIPALLAEITAAAERCPIGEIIYVDDGSADDSRSLLVERMAELPMLRVLCHERSQGQSAAMLAGGRAATGKLLVFMDADLQNDAADIVGLYDRFREAGPTTPVAVLGQRAVRHDSLLRRWSSVGANRIRAAILRDHTRDTGCSLKLIAKEDFLALPHFNHLHRFLPALLIRHGVELLHVDVKHRPRQHGRSKYGFWNRAFVGLVDLFGVAWLQRRRLPAAHAARELASARSVERQVIGR